MGDVTDPAREIGTADSGDQAKRIARMSDGADFSWQTDQAPASAKGRAFRDHWLGLRGDRVMPPRGALDPLDIAPLLPHIVLVDVLGGPMRLRYRLIGTFVTELAGRDATGRFVDRALYGRNLEAVAWPYRQVAQTRAPVATLSGALFSDRDWQCIENMFVPFGDGEAVEMIAVCIDLDSSRIQRDITTGRVLDWNR
jgi:hypothetical protein